MTQTEGRGTVMSGRTSLLRGEVDLIMEKNTSPQNRKPLPEQLGRALHGRMITATDHITLQFSDGSCEFRVGRISHNIDGIPLLYIPIVDGLTKITVVTEENKEQTNRQTDKQTNKLVS